MRGVVQRVLSAKAVIDGETVGEIGQGLLVLVCAMPTDTEAVAGRFLDKLLKLRIFENDAGKLHHAVTDIDGTGTVGGLLLVSQFTLAADVTGGTGRVLQRRHRPIWRATCLTMWSCKPNNGTRWWLPGALRQTRRFIW